MTFEQVVLEVWGTPELMAEYRRLTGSTLGADTRPPIVRLIDDATGRDHWEANWQPFFEFVRDCVWLPLIARELAA